MSVPLEKRDGELLLAYMPEEEMPDYTIHLLLKGEVRYIRRTFFVTKELLREYDAPEDIGDTLWFCIGKVGEEYTEIDHQVIRTEHRFFFSNEMKLSEKLFVASKNISILSKIDKEIDRDFYVGGNWEQHNGIPEEVYRKLVKSFPSTTEIYKYIWCRISNILQEFFPECSRYEKIYWDYMDRKKQIKWNNAGETNTCFDLEIRYEQFSSALNELKHLLYNGAGQKETFWQEKIYPILRWIYPKYICVTREMEFKGLDDYDKKPDFVLVDMNGFVDLLEIKRPDVQILTARASYRNNYVPTRELSGAAQQIEKYIFCLNTIEKNREIVAKKFAGKLPEGVQIQVLNPQGMLLLGRSRDFNRQQKNDFELVKRQYKHIADIMTYDDLISRMENIVAALKDEIDFCKKAEQ